MSFLRWLVGAPSKEEQQLASYNPAPGVTAAPAAGDIWDGLFCYTTDPVHGRPGYYALEDDGKTVVNPPVLLTHIDLAPGDDHDGRGVWVVVDVEEPYFSHAPAHERGNYVNLEANVKGTSAVTGGEPHGSR